MRRSSKPRSRSESRPAPRMRSRLFTLAGLDARGSDEREALALFEQHVAAPGGRVTAFDIGRGLDRRDEPEIAGNAAGTVVGRRSGAGLDRNDQPVFIVDEGAAAIIGHLESRREHDRVRRARFLAHPAENAAQLVDLVARGVPLAGRSAILGGVLRADDRDCVCGTDTRAELAADAALLAVVIAA